MDKEQANKRLKEIYEAFSSSTKGAHKAYLESIHALVNLTEIKDPYTKRHSVKVSNYAALLAQQLGMRKRDIENVKFAAILHDIGKLGVSAEILLKEGSLSKKEFEEVKKHSLMGVEIIKPLHFFGEIILMIKHHHENFDGSGYPSGLKGKDIPLGAQILSIADAYDALISERAYRKAYSHDEALEIMKKDSGKKFDPKLLNLFIKCLTTREKRMKEFRTAKK